MPVKRYIVFDKQSDMEQGEQYINALMGNDDPYYDKYTYNEEYEESDTVEDDTDSALTADGKSITTQDMAIITRVQLKNCILMTQTRLAVHLGMVTVLC